MIAVQYAKCGEDKKLKNRLNEVSTHTAAYTSTKKQLGGLTRRENKKKRTMFNTNVDFQQFPSNISSNSYFMSPFL